jgi:predicted porin
MLIQRIVAAACALSALSDDTPAQSSVTVYGRINLSLEHQKANAGTSDKLVDNASRIGFTGSEDLGGGLKAGFTLEHGFNADTGLAAQPAFWARQSEVNLSGGLGTVRLGNFTSEAYFATADYVSLHNHDTGTSADALYAYLGRNANKLSYRTPAFGAATVEVAGALTEGLPAIANRSYDVAVNHALGPLQLGAGYEKNGEAHQFAFRALYPVGGFLLGGYAQRDKNGYAAGTRTNLRLAGAYLTGPHEVHLNVGHAGAYSKTPDSAAWQYTLAYNHNLSRRTKVYAFLTRVSDGAAAVYGGSSSAIAAGVRHNF